MVRNLIPTCSKCGSLLSDHIEPEVKKEGLIKEGKYVDNVWICNECLKYLALERDSQRTA